MSRKSTRVGTPKQTNFAEAVHSPIRRSGFVRRKGLKTTFNAGRLIPLHLDEVLPSDVKQLSVKALIRMTTPMFPVMDDVYFEIFAFFVPNRIVWTKGWERLISNTNTQGAWAPEAPVPLVPAYESAHFNNMGPVISGSIGDYYTLPPGFRYGDLNPVSVLPFRGYGKIWEEWFRDQNVQAPLVLYDGDIEPTGRTGYSLTDMPRWVNRHHDLFSSCLPSPQKGTSPLIPIGVTEARFPVMTQVDSADVRNLSGSVNMSHSTLLWSNLAGGSYSNSTTSPNPVAISQPGSNQPFSPTMGFPAGLSTPGTGIQVRPRNLWATVNANELFAPGTINELRTAWQIQRLLERDARGGTARYREMLLAHFATDAQDYRLQRPEFLGRVRVVNDMIQVPQTSSTIGFDHLGDLAAFSQTFTEGMLFKKTFVEHGFIHVFMVARHPKTYQQGVDRMFSRRDRFDFYFPVLAGISEQPIMLREIYAPTTPPAEITGNTVFGYNEAWAHYRYMPNVVTGQMRSGVDNSFDKWHYADWYSSTPYLSDLWMRDNSEDNVNRTLTLQSYTDDGFGNRVEGVNQFWADIRFTSVELRPMPVNSIPGLVDHF